MGTGALGKTYKAINPDAIYMGMELNKESVKLQKITWTSFGILMPKIRN